MTFMKGLPLLLLIASLCSYAALQPDRTRIVFNANDKATSLRVDNRSDKLPYLAYCRKIAFRDRPVISRSRLA